MYEMYTKQNNYLSAESLKLKNLANAFPFALIY